MNNPAFDIKDMLEAESSLGLVFATNLFIGREPATPIDCVTIYDTPGNQASLSMDQNSYYYPSIQIRVRSANYLTAWSLIQSIKDSLHGRAQETWNGTLYSLIVCSGEPSLLNWDVNDRVHLIANFNLQRR